MATKVIESTLEKCGIVNAYEVEYVERKDMYIIDLDIFAPRDNTITADLIKLQSLLRSQVNRAFRLKFILNYTI